MSRIYVIEQARVNRGSWGRRAFVDGYHSIRDTLRRLWMATKPGKLKHPSLQRRFCTRALPLTCVLILTLSHVAAILMPQNRLKKPSFPKVKPHTPNTMHTPSGSDLPFIGRLKRSLWILGARLKERDVKYAFKAGMGMAILAAPAFFDATRPVFMYYRGEWALISVRIVNHIHS
jgi:hypothetical protein